jgi:pyroglutamyl-peptidase
VHTLLLTGFEPFDGWDTNPSWDIASALDGHVVAGARIVSRVLPVDWDRSWSVLQSCISELQPEWLVMIGLASTRDAISVETQARNVRGPKPDNSGVMGEPGEIEPGAEAALATTLPAGRMLEAMSSLEVPARYSDDAGTYLCNHTLYRALAWAGSGAEGAPAIGFIHVPNLPDLPIEKMTRAVAAVCEAVVRSEKAAKD